MAEGFPRARGMKLGGGPPPSAWPQCVRMPSEGSPPFIYDSSESEDLRSTCLTLAAGQAPSGRCRSKPHAPHAETACLRCRRDPAETAPTSQRCVFYAALTGRDPTRSGFTAGLGAG
jgi:hypothetical protein